MSVTQQQIERIENLAVEIESWSDASAQTTAQRLTQEILALHASGLGKIVELMQQNGQCGVELLDQCASDPLISSLFLLHGLHPKPLEERVHAALDSVRPYLQSHGGDVELLDVSQDAVRLRLTGSCHGCPSSAATMKHSIEKAIYEAAPDVVAVEVESLSAAKSDLLQISTVW